MSELKAYMYDDMIDGDADTNIEYYPKSEADKVIADKDAKILALDAEVFKQKHHANMFFDERNYAENQLRRQKYKRCLAMAYVEWLKQMTLCYNPESILYRRACRREHKWKELAEKFKPNNSTAQ